MSENRWRARVTSYLVSQGVAQMVGFGVGVLVVRSLSLEEYAQYVVATTVLAAVVMLSDSGTTSAVLSLGARAQHGSSRMSIIFQESLAFRRIIAAVVGLLGAASLMPLLLLNGAEPLTAAIVLVITLTGVWPTLTRGVMINVLRLRGDTGNLQRLALFSSGLRLALAVVGVAIGLATGISGLFFFLLIGLAAAAFEDVYVWRKANLPKSELADIGLKAEIRQILWGNFRRTLPMNLVIVVQTQLLYLLLSLFGSPETVATVAAMSRFALVFVILNNTVSDVAAGLAAKLPSSGKHVSRFFAIVLLGYLLASAGIVGLSYPMAPLLLEVLGDGYTGLEGPLVIVAAGSALINFGNAFRSLNQARGWVAGSWVYIPLTAGWAVVGPVLLDLNQPVDASVFMALQAVSGIVAQTVCFGIGRRRPSEPVSET